MSIFQTRSRNNSSAAMGTRPSSQPLYHPQSQQHQQQQQGYQHQRGHSSHNLQTPQDGSGSSGSIDQHSQQQQHNQEYGQHGGQSMGAPGGSGGKVSAAAARPQLFSDFFRRYELMIEFTNLRNPHHCPSGLYVMPAADNMNQWFGTLFIHKGYYRNAVFKFQLVIPQDYPDRRPTVHFLSDVWHPLIDQHGQLALQYQFPQWRPHRDYLFHILHFIKSAFKKCVLDSIVEKQAVNKEAFRMYRQENKIFAKLAQQRAQLSITETSLYDNYPANNSIKFSPLHEDEFKDLKQKMVGNPSTMGFAPPSLVQSSPISLEELKARLAE
ncbi:hypothetical protein EDD11_002418 [Mortierella claussenii]|nr:hypothetical protein EDD11_002418 [Mortierella claussenii]